MSGSHLRQHQSAQPAFNALSPDKEADMPATEKDLAEDAPWKKIQQNTFTRWCNEHLKCVNKRIANLQTDLGDGLRLIGLLEVLSQKKMFRKYNQRPTFRQMQLENVSVALEFLDKENIKLVSIDSKAIVDGNLKLILGMVWTLILHYSISMPMWDEEEEGGDGQQKTPKQRLLGWIQNKLPEIPIHNFSRDWQSGRALGALVDSCAPGLCPDWDQWDQTKPVDNAREAMQQADDWLGIPQVITPEEIVDPNVDEHSVMTYLSQFPKSKLKPGAPLRPKLNPKKARAYGPGIEPVGNVVMKKAMFTVETISAGMGEVLVYVEDPAGHKEEAKVTANNDKNRTYSVFYIPKVTGMHKVTVLFAGLHINKSPYEVDVGMAQGDSSKATAQGPGLEPAGNIANKTTYFDVYTAGAGVGEVEVVIMDPAGKKDVVVCQIEDKGNSSYRCTYKPTLEGAHTIYVTFAGGQISKSPFTVNIGEACNPSLVRAKGRGLQPKGLRVKETADFRVFTKGAGTGELKVTIKGPKGLEEPCKRKDLGDGVFGFEYYPTTPGTYSITITWGGQHIPRSPLEVKIGLEAGPQKVRAWGPGLESGIVGKSADFVVEAVGENVGTLGFSVEGPSQAKIECDDKGDGSCDVRYWPMEAGEYAVHVLCNNEDIQHSPFMAEITAALNKDYYPDKVKAYGPGLQSSGLAVGKPTEFTVDAKLGGNAALNILAQDGEGTPVDVQVKDNGNGTYTCSYTPKKPLKHTVMASWGGVNIPDSPFRMTIGAGCHPNKVKVSGPGVAKTGLKAFEPTFFTVDCAEAGQGDISIGIKCSPGVVGPAEADIDFDIIRNDNDTFTVKYTPPGAGSYTIMVLFADQVGSVGETRTHLTRPTHFTPTHFTVNTKAAGKAKLDAVFSGPAKGEAVKDFEIINNHDNTHTVKYTPIQQGPLGVAVTYGGDSIPKSPFSIPVAPSLDLSKIQVDGLGDKITVGKDQEVTVKSKGAGGQGKVGAKVTGPSGKPVTCKVEPGLKPETSQVKFIPREAGPYQVELTYDSAPIPGSPFKPTAYPPTDATKVNMTSNPMFTVQLNTSCASPLCQVKCSGPGLERAKVGETGEFVVDCTNAGPAELTIEIISDSGTEAEVHIQDNGDGTYTITYIPLYPGSYTLTIRYGGQDVPNFPARLTVEPAVDASGIRVFGPGVEGKGVFREATTDFTVDARALNQTGGNHIKTVIQNPSGSVTDAVITDRRDGTYNVEYTPYEEGPHSVKVAYDESPVPKSPFRVAVTEGCDPGRVRAHGPGLDSGITNKANKFTVETRGAGTGGLGLAVEGPSEAKMSCTDNKDGSCSVEYIPYEAGTYNLNITYGGQPIAGSPFQVPVSDTVDSSKVKCQGVGLGTNVRANIPQAFTVDASKAGVAPLQVRVQGPKGVVEPAELVDNGDQTHTVNYIPTREGPYSINVLYADQEIPRSPYKVKVLPTHDASKVRASGPGLNTTGVPASLPVEFTIDAKDAGEGLLAVQITDPEGKPKKASIRDNQDGTYLVSYVPDMTGRYTILIKYGGDEIPYSPYRIRALPTGDASKCTVTGNRHTHRAGVGPTIQIGEQTVITVDAKAAGKGKVTCSVCTPEGVELDVDVVENEDGTFDIFYTAPQPGDYCICVRFGGELIPNSPFLVTALEGAPSDQLLQQQQLPQYYSQQPWATDRPMGMNGLDVAGLRPFDLVIPFTIQKGEITGDVRMPSGKTAKPDITDNKDGTVTVKYAPTEAGLHEMDIKYDGIHIPGSPLQFYVDYVNSGNVSAYGPGLIHGTVNKPAMFTVNTKDAGEGGLSLAIEGPSKADISCVDNQDGTCSVSYLPVLPGDYSILVKYNDKHIPGSPFSAHITGDDSMRMSHLKVGSAADIPLDIGPSKVDINTEDQEDGTCKLVSDACYTCVAGDYEVSIRFNEEHIPDSPFVVPVASPSDDARRLTVASLQESGLKVNHPASFAVSLNGAKGQIDAKVHSPSGALEGCCVTELDQDKYAVRFIPRENGLYLIDVKFNGSHIPGSPFKIRVGETGQAGDPGMVTAYGAGLEGGTTGTACEFVVNTSKAGPGALAVTIDGPSKVKMDCVECPEGYKVTYTPMAPGNYLISIRYGGPYHIVGSPFKAKITGSKLVSSHSNHETSSVMVDPVTRQVSSSHQGAPSQSDASCVTAKGLGLSKGFIGQKNNFSVDCSKAGRNMLLVGVDGPRVPCEEVLVKHLGNRVYNISYQLKEKGEYILVVKWGEQHIPGSPYHITV
uniref:Calponin-homology (CH) domain-containing protein n=1 Tax=Oncorhynchus tshawytscha TaxID=74940 RepID=A0AAZ3RFQ2_ONCTS